MTVGPTEAGPGVTERRSEPWERPKPRPWLRSPYLGACESARPSSRRGGSIVTPPRGRSGGVASTTRPPASSPKARRRCSVQDDLPILAEARAGRPPGVEHGNGGSRPKGLCKHNPIGMEDHPRVLERVIRSNNPVRGRKSAGPKPCAHRSWVERTLVRNAMKRGVHRNARCELSRFIRSLYRQYKRAIRPPRLQLPYALFPIYPFRLSFHVETPSLFTISH